MEEVFRMYAMSDDEANGEPTELDSDHDDFATPLHGPGPPALADGPSNPLSGNYGATTLTLISIEVACPVCGVPVT